MKQLKIINPRNVSNSEADAYKLRIAARAVVIDQDGLIALLHATRDSYYKRQISYCYVAKVRGQKGQPNLTESEKERGLKVIWVSYKEAIDLFKKSIPTQFEGEYIVPRDLSFLEEAKCIVN